RVGVELQTEVGRIQNLLLRDIRGAESVSNYPEIDPIFQSDADTLVLRLPSINIDGDVIPASFDYIIYEISDSGPYAITRQLVANGAGRTSDSQVISTNVSAIAYHYDASPITTANNIDAEITVSKIYQSTPNTLTTSLTVRMRN
ncbi:MAG: hypothetical protein V1838_03885, partial [Patescibacteria group bacterium]